MFVSKLQYEVDSIIWIETQINQYTFSHFTTVCVAGPITKAIIEGAHGGVAGGHFSSTTTIQKILTALYWWPDLQRMYTNTVKDVICVRKTQAGQ